MAEKISKRKYEDIMVRGKNEQLKQKLVRDLRDRKVEVERVKR